MELRKVIASTLALALVATSVGVTAPDSAAKVKKPKLKKKKISVIKGKTAKITVKGKKIKKTKWSIKSKKVAALSKKKKTSVVVKGKKAGKKTTVTAKVTVKGKKKPYTLKCTVTVKKAGNVKPSVKPSVKPTATPTKKPTDKPPVTPTPIVTPTPEPSLRPLKKVDKVTVAKQEADVFPTTPPNPTVNPATAVGYDVDFEDVTIGTKTQDAVTGAGIKGAVLRGCGEDNQTNKDYLEVVDASTLVDGNGDAVTGNTSHVLKCHREKKAWQGPMFDLTNTLDAGCTYSFTADVFSPDTDLQGSYQLQTTENTPETYGNFGPTAGTTTKLEKGKWNSVNFTISIPDDKYYYALYFESFNGSGHGDIYVDNIKLTKTVQSSRNPSIASLKDTYKDVFDIFGVGAGIDSLFGDSGIDFITSQYTAYTPGNEMKPDAIMGSSLKALTIEQAKEKGYVIPDNYTKYEDNKNTKGEMIVPELNFDTVDQIMKTCHDKGLKLRGHTLVWHEQTPSFFFQKNYKSASGVKNNTKADVMDVRLEFYVKTVMKHVLTSEYADCLYAYDVVNEYLHSANAASNAKPTYWGSIYGTPTDKVKSGVSLRPKYVKEAFQFAHEMLVQYNKTNIKLFYNDYNCYQYPEDIVHLTDFINEDKKICDGIGMQAHLDISDDFHSASNFATALEVFRVNAPDLDIQITELDATMKSTASKTLTDEDQAAYYDQIMNAILTNKKKGGKITGLIIWSLYDGVSWRAQQTPCIFSGLYSPKSSYYAVKDAKKLYWDTPAGN